jgi:hypothetical protein
VAIASSDITLLSADLDGVATAIRLSRRTFRTILQNLGWAFGYNTAAIPLAVAGLLNPIIAGAAMAFSSVSVVTNSLRLARFRRRRVPTHSALPVPQAASVRPEPLISGATTNGERGRPESQPAVRVGSAAAAEVSADAPDGGSELRRRTAPPDDGPPTSRALTTAAAEPSEPARPAPPAAATTTPDPGEPPAAALTPAERPTVASPPPVSEPAPAPAPPLAPGTTIAARSALGQRHSSFGRAVIFTATVRSSASTPVTGKVTFLDGASVLGSGVLDAAGQARCITSALEVGEHEVTAVYAGDGNFIASRAMLVHRVHRTATTTAVVVSAPTTSFGDVVTLTATVRPEVAGPPTGTVTFSDGDAVLGMVPLDRSGTARLSKAALPVGERAVTARYGGDARFAPSSMGTTHTVAKAATTLLLSAAELAGDRPPPAEGWS